MPDTFRLSASFRTSNNAAWTSAAAYTGADTYDSTGREEVSQFIGEFRLLKVKGLTTIIVGVLDNLGSFSDKGTILFSENFAYKVSDDLNIGLNAAQFLYNREEDADPALLFNLWGSYAIGKAVPRLDFVYFWGGQSKTGTSTSTGTNAGAAQWERRGFLPRNGIPGDNPNRAVSARKGVDDDYSLFSVRPSVRINVDSRTFLEIGDIINFDFANHYGYNKDKSPVATTNSGDTKSRLTNVFYIDVRFSF
jgi:hypothetical protein